MRPTHNAFHLAIPVAQIDRAVDFYSNTLELKLLRRFDERAVFNFFGDQLVCRLCPEGTDDEASIHPRHFGMLFQDRTDYLRILKRLQTKGVNLLEGPLRRDVGTDIAHETFFIADPDNNVIEFKCFDDPVQVVGDPEDAR